MRYKISSPLDSVPCRSDLIPDLAKDAIFQGLKSFTCG